MANLRDETLNIIKLIEKKAEKDTKPILQAYKRALTETREEIAKLYVKYAVDGKLKMSQKQRYSYLKQLEKQLIEQAKELGNIDLEHTTKILNDIYKESYYRTAFTIDKGIDSSINFALLNPKMVEEAVNIPIEGRMFSDRIWKNKKLLVNRVRLSIERGIIQGKSIDKLAKDIKNVFGSSAYESKRLINTELNRVVSQAQNKIYQESNVVDYVMWDSVLEPNTKKYDASLQGKKWRTNEPHPIPPLHPNCKCTLIPIISGWKPTKKRDTVTGEIVDYESMTYENWAKRKGII